MKYLKEIIKKNRKLIFVYILTGVLISFFKNFNAQYYEKLIDSFNNNTLNIWNIVIYGGALLLLHIIEYLDEYPGRKLENTIIETSKIEALKKVSTVDYEEYEKIGTGELIQRIDNGAEAGKGILFDYYFCIFREILPSMIFSIFFIWKINITVMYTILAGYIFVFIVTNLLLKALYKIKEKILINEELMNHYIVRGFMEMVVFRINKKFKEEIKKSSDAKDEIVTSKVKMTLIHEAFFTIFAILVALIKIWILFYAWKMKSITIGSAIALISLVDNAYTPIAIFNVLFIQYKLDKTAYKRYENFLNLSDDKNLLKGQEVKEIKGNIKFDNVSFSYGKRNVLNNMNLDIRSGEKTALVGESGSGKSTVIKLLLGLLKTDKGTITVDDYDISNVKLSDFYDHVSYISQETPIFDGTLRENIVLDKNVDDNEIIDVLKKVKLFDMYKKLEDGLDQRLGERGITLSGGERQRLALARLWFDKKEIVVLDEATSALDNITEEEVMKEVINLLNGKTTIAIAHKLNTIINFDNIMVFKSGQKIAQGTFNELMENNDYFNKLYNENH